jgi:UDP-N-acetylglucosamine diphosphorylase / glucose-1-phosphate thymidylyltransferase / UDP-N-acetylgalactosamine diphosphorylase / glucosamine-1-phosphate N-acetyltransferase / galactosamine-1-phosphate N-acetyltransferase
MSTLYLLEPVNPGAAWAPFAGATPISELRAGMWRLRERWERGLSSRTAGVIAAHVAGHQIIGGPSLVGVERIVGPAWVVDVTFAPRLPMRAVGTAKRLVHGGKTVAWRLDAGQRWDGPFTQGDGVVVEGKPLAGAFDLITALEQLLFTDTLAALDGATDPIPAGTIVFGNADAIALRGAELEPGVVLDARKGAIVLERGVHVRSGTRLEGPFWAGTGTMIVGGQLRHVSVGPHCRVHGEISTSVFNGYANKSHDGFLGHSVVGEWANLGAGTITSNLKNTYGPIRLDVGEQRIETQRTNLGSLIGDHVKTAIGTLLPTGAVIGAGANLFGSPRAPKYIAPFAWGGDTAERIAADQFVAMAKRILPRRDVAVDAPVEASLRALHARLAQQ